MIGEQDNYVIYIHTSPSGKSYIGQTNNYSRRCGVHKQRSHNNCRAFKNAIDKYGWVNFNHSIIHTGLSLDQANFYEELYIKEYNTLSPNGYNLTTGGGNFKFSEECIENMRISRKGRPSSKKGQPGFKPTPESIQKMLNTKLERYGKYPSYIPTQSTKDIWSKQRKGKNVRPVSIDGVDYESIADAANKLNWKRDKVRWRVTSDNFPDAYFLTDSIVHDPSGNTGVPN